MHQSHAPTMRDFVKEMYTFPLHNGALWAICLMQFGICEMGPLYHMPHPMQACMQNLVITHPDIS